MRFENFLSLNGRTKGKAATTALTYVNNIPPRRYERDIRLKYRQAGTKKLLKHYPGTKYCDIPYMIKKCSKGK